MSYKKLTFSNDIVQEMVAPQPHYQEIYLHSASGIIYIGDDANVTQANGYRMDNGDKLTYTLSPGVGLWGIAGAGSPYMYVMNNLN